MIKVNCIVENVSKTGHPQIEVNSVKDTYNAVEITMGSGKVVVFADDIIQAVENCSHNGTRRRFVPAYRRSDDEEE